MKYYSEKLDKMFDSEDDLFKAEEEKAENELAVEKEKTALSKAKKAEADKVQLTDKEVDEAQENLKKVREEAQAKIDAARKEAEDMLKEAYKKLSVAQEHRFEALKAFNEKFGPYKTYYTGEKAYNEFQKTLRYFDNIFNDFRWFF